MRVLGSASHRTWQAGFQLEFIVKLAARPKASAKRMLSSACLKDLWLDSPDRPQQLLFLTMPNVEV